MKSIREAMDRRRAPFYLRRTKEAMVYFPERQPDGTWVASKIFTKRIPHTVDFQIDGDEFELYTSVTRFVKRQSAAAAAQRRRPACPRRRLPDGAVPAPAGVEHLRRALLAGKPGQAARRGLLKKRPGDRPRARRRTCPTRTSWRRWRRADRERWKRMLEAITLAGNAEQVREEIAELEQLAVQAKAVEETGSEAKLAKLQRPDRRSKASSTTRTSGCCSSPSSRTRSTTSVEAGEPGASASGRSTAA